MGVFSTLHPLQLVKAPFAEQLGLERACTGLFFRRTKGNYYDKLAKVRLK